MEKLTLKVEGMGCEHCVNTITKALKALPGMSSVAVDLKAKTVTVECDTAQCSREKIAREIEDAGYDVVA